MKASSFADLKKMRAALAQQQQERQAALARQQQLAREREALKQVFRAAVADVQPLPASTSAALSQLAREKPAPEARQRQLDEQAVLGEAISDDFDVTTLLETDDGLSWRQPTIGADVLRKLRKGEWSIQGQIDLHGLRREEAREALADFLRSASKHGLRCVRVVHGKGLGSVNKEPVLKGRVRGWLIQKKEVIAFCQAKPSEGGAGALVVLLAPSQR